MKLYTHIFHCQHRGFVALIATIVISLILTTVVLGRSQNSFFVRSEVFYRELKKTSEFLAYACIEKAIQNLSNDFLYSPPISGEIVPVGADSCTIVNMIHGPENPSHTKVVVVSVKAESVNSHTAYVANIEIVNPKFSNYSEPKIVSFKEVSTLP